MLYLGFLYFAFHEDIYPVSLCYSFDMAHSTLCTSAHVVSSYQKNILSVMWQTFYLCLGALQKRQSGCSLSIHHGMKISEHSAFPVRLLL